MVKITVGYGREEEMLRALPADPISLDIVKSWTGGPLYVTGDSEEGSGHRILGINKSAVVEHSKRSKGLPYELYWGVRRFPE